MSEEEIIDWRRLPYLDSPSIFAKIPDKNKGGFFSFFANRNYIIILRFF